MESQKQLFAQFAGGSRFLYNRGLEERKRVYEQSGKHLSYFDQNNELVPLKREEATSWLKGIHSQVLQQALKNLDTAFQNFFQNIKKGKKPGFPRFKCKGVRDSFRYPQGVHIERAARRNPAPLGAGQASYLFGCDKELGAHYRSGESPSFEEKEFFKQK